MKPNEEEMIFQMGDYDLTMRDSFTAMFHSRELIDCVLICSQNISDNIQRLGNQNKSHESEKSIFQAQVLNNSSIKAHQVILSSASEYFRLIFSSVNNLNKDMTTVIINDVHYEDLKAIIKFVYTGEVSVLRPKVKRFLRAAQLLRIKGLINIRLVPEEDELIDDSTVALNESQIIRLKDQNQSLIEELEVLKKEKMNAEFNIRKEVEEEFKKKLDIEKELLDKQREQLNVEKEASLERHHNTAKKEIKETKMEKDYEESGNYLRPFTNDDDGRGLPPIIDLMVSQEKQPTPVVLEKNNSSMLIDLKERKQELTDGISLINSAKQYTLRSKHHNLNESQDKIAEAIGENLNNLIPVLTQVLNKNTDYIESHQESQSSSNTEKVSNLLTPIVKTSIKSRICTPYIRRLSLIQRSPKTKTNTVNNISSDLVPQQSDISGTRSEVNTLCENVDKFISQNPSQNSGKTGANLMTSPSISRRTSKRLINTENESQDSVSKRIRRRVTFIVK